LPVFLVILNDAETIDPEIKDAEIPANIGNILKEARQVAERYRGKVVAVVSGCCLRNGARGPPAVAKCNVFPTLAF